MSAWETLVAARSIELDLSPGGDRVRAGGAIHWIIWTAGIRTRLKHTRVCDLPCAAELTNTNSRRNSGAYEAQLVRDPRHVDRSGFQWCQRPAPDAEVIDVAGGRNRIGSGGVLADSKPISAVHIA